jgi:hypothetical protein
MTATSDFNLLKLDSKQMYDNMLATIQFGGAAFFAGRRGSSKTMQAKKAIKDSGCREVYLNLSLCERVDLGGYPNFFAGQNKKYIDFLMPSWYEKLIEGDEPCVVLFDEVDKVSSDIYAPLLEIVQFRTVNGNPLKNLKAIIMTGNLLSEGGSRPSLPLLDRAEKFLIEMNAEQFLEWGGATQEIHPSVSAFIHDNREELYGDVDPGEMYADPSPRGWHNASKILNFGEKNGWHPDMMKHKVSACVGKKAGYKYSSFFEHYQVLLPVVEKIMAGEKTSEFSGFEKTKQLVVGMIVCQRFATILDKYILSVPEKQRGPGMVKLDANDAIISKNVSKFMSRMDIEMGLISLRSQIGMERVIRANLLQDPDWDSIMTGFLAKLKGGN